MDLSKAECASSQQKKAPLYSSVFTPKCSTNPSIIRSNLVQEIPFNVRSIAHDRMMKKYQVDPNFPAPQIPVKNIKVFEIEPKSAGEDWSSRANNDDKNTCENPKTTVANMSKMGRLESDTDFNTVTVLRKSGPPIKTCRTQGEILAAQRRGAEIETNKKWGAGGNVQHGVSKNATKLDNETEELHHERVPLSVGKAIQQGRQAKEMTQKDLATKICEKPQIVAEYESGKAVPNPQILGKMERALGIKLRGKEIGKPLTQPKKDAPKK